MSTLIVRPSIGRLLHHNKKIHSQWLPVLLLRVMGYSSFAAAIVSMIVYWYKKQQQQQQHHTTITADSKQQVNDGDEELLLMNPKKKLHITTSSSMMRRSSSSLSNLNARNSLLTPPPSPLQQGIQSPPRSISPRSNSTWGSRLIDGVISATRKRKRMTISLKNTILWNPSQDVNTPNHAFHENTVLLLNKLVQVYDIYVIIHMNSEQERHQIHQLLNNANLSIDPRKILYCSTEQGKLHLIKHIQPAIHVEGGWELDDGSSIIEQLNDSVEQMIWIKKTNSNNSSKNIESADNILKTCIAKQVGFE